MLSTGGRRPGIGRKSPSFDFLDQNARLPKQRLQLASLLNGLAGVVPVLERILVAAWRARSRRAAMHSTSPFPADCGCHAGLARTRFSPAAHAREHRAGVARMICLHLFAPIRAARGLGTGLSMMGIGACCEWMRAFGLSRCFDGAACGAAWVTGPTMA
jgi:hypothetical protein